MEVGLLVPLKATTSPTRETAGMERAGAGLSLEETVPRKMS